MSISRAGRERCNAGRTPVSQAAARHRDRHPHDRHDRRAAADLDRLSPLHAHRQRRRPVHHAAQSLEPAGPDLLDRGHGDGHGADHRDAPYRPFRRLDPGLHLDDHRRRSGLFARQISRPRQSHIWIIASSLRSPSARRSAPSTGSLVAYLGIPAFIVTLGGQLFWRGAAWWVTTGATIAPLDERFRSDGRRPARLDRRDGELDVGRARLRRHHRRALRGRRRRARYNFPLRPMWAELTLAVDRLFRRARRDLGRQRLSLAGTGRPTLCGSA